MKIIFKSYIFLFFLFLLSNTSAQENLIFQKIIQAKSTGINFKIYSSAFTLAAEDKSILNYFLNPEMVYFLKFDELSSKDLSSAISMKIPLRTRDLELELLEVPSSFYNYEVVTNDGKRIVGNRNIRHYRGIIKDNSKSLVALTFLENEVMGLIVTEEGNFNLFKDNRLGLYVFYNEKNLLQKPKFECGTNDNYYQKYDPEVLSRKLKLTLNSTSKCVKLYFETEHDIFQARGSLASVEGFVTGIYNQVATLFENEDIETGISEILVWTSTDPYTSQNSDDLLTQFQSQRTYFNGDLGNLLTFRNIGGGKAASFDGICNTNVAQKLAVSMLYNSYENVPTYSYSVFAITHELGHLLGSLHTHACVWNGNNTAIDGCADFTEGGCDLPGIPYNGGTIMSYCHWKSVGINFSLGFGIQPGNVIRNSIDNANCLCECIEATITGPTLICASGTTLSLNTSQTVDSIIWIAGLNINIYSGQYTTSCTFSSSGNGPSWIRARLVNDCGSIILPYYQVWRGWPQNASISASLRNWGSYWEIRYFATQMDNVEYQWKIDGNIQEYYGPFCSYIAPECGGDPELIFQDFNVEVSLINECDTARTCNIFRFTCGEYNPSVEMIGNCGETEEMLKDNDISILVAPNPANDNIKISIYKKYFRIGNAFYKNRDINILPDLEKSYKFRISSGSGILVYSSNLIDNSVTISTTGLINGVYFVEINDGIKTFSQQFIIKH